MSLHGFTPLAPLPPIGGVERDLCVDDARHVQVEVARYPRVPALPPAFALEARRIQEVRHPCLAPVVGVVVPDEAMPEEDGAVIEAHAQGPRLAVGAAVPHAAALRIAADLADALAVLHAAELVHGALGPDAVVLDALGRPVMMGVGTPILRAAALGEDPPALTAADDVRGLGVVLYSLICGREPGDPPLAPSSLAPTIPPALNGLILSLLSRDALRPPPPAAAVGLRLREMVGDPPPGISPPPPRPRRERPPRRERAVVVPPPEEGTEVVVVATAMPSDAPPPRAAAAGDRRPPDAVLMGGVLALIAAGLLTAFALREDETPAPTTQTVVSVRTTTTTVPATATGVQGPLTVVPSLPSVPLVTVVGGQPQSDPLSLPATVVVTVTNATTVPGPPAGTSVLTVPVTTTVTATSVVTEVQSTTQTVTTTEPGTTT